MESGSLQLTPLRTLKSDFIINRLAWHPDNKTLAVGQNLNKKIAIWSIETRQVIRVLDKEAGGVGALAYSPDGKYLAVGRVATRHTPDHAHVHLYGAYSGELVRRFVPPAAEKGDANDVGAIAFSPDSRRLATHGYGGGGVGVVYDLPSGKVVAKLGDGTGILYSLAFSPDGRWLAVGRTDRVGDKKNERGAYELAIRVQLWNTASWKIEKQASAAGGISGLAFSPDGKHLAVDQTVEEYPGAAAGSKLLPYNDKTAISILAVPALVREKIIPVQDRSPQSGFFMAASPQAYSGDGRFLFTGGPLVKVIDVTAGSILQEIKFTQAAHFPAVSKDGKYLAIGSDQVEVRLYELIR